jgi:hypothetical protein
MAELAYKYFNFRDAAVVLGDDASVASADGAQATAEARWLQNLRLGWVCG